MTRNNQQTTSAFVFDRKLANKRPAFMMEMALQQNEQKIVTCERDWYGVGSDVIARETLTWSKQHGLQKITMHNNSLNETGQLTHHDGVGEFLLCSEKTHHIDKVKSTHFKYNPASLLSLPFETAKHWHELKQGKKLTFDYSVLKAQAHTGILLQASNEHDFFVVKFTPISLFWRLIFGSSYMYFDKEKPILHKIDGLIEPRDRKPNGRYKEYLASMAFSTPLDLSQCVM